MVGPWRPSHRVQLVLLALDGMGSPANSQPTPSSPQMRCGDVVSEGDLNPHRRRWSRAEKLL